MNTQNKKHVLTRVCRDSRNLVRYRVGTRVACTGLIHHNSLAEIDAAQTDRSVGCGSLSLDSAMTYRRANSVQCVSKTHP